MNVSIGGGEHVVVTTVRAEDADTGEYGRVKYYLMSELSLIYFVDPESVSQYGLTIKARDNDLAPSNEQRATPGHMTVRLVDVNNSPPVFDQLMYVGNEITENSVLGSQLRCVVISRYRNVAFIVIQEFPGRLKIS